MEENLATELLREIKAQTKRWFIAFIVMCVLEISTIGIFIWYVSLPVEEVTTTTSYEVSQESDENSSNQIIEGDYNGE